MQAAVDPDTNLVTIQATADDADLAAALANALARQTKKVVTEDRGLAPARDDRPLQETIKDEPDGIARPGP